MPFTIFVALQLTYYTRGRQANRQREIEDIDVQNVRQKDKT